MEVLNKAVIVIVLSAISCVNSVRILGYFPIPFHSHQSVFQALVEELSRNGHELMVLTPLPHDKPLENVTEIDVHDISYRMWDESFKEFFLSQSEKTMNPVEMWIVGMPLIYKIMEAQISVPEMQAIIKDKNQHFDVILVEAFSSLPLMLAARFNAPLIQVSSFFGTEENYISMGASTHPSIFPEYTIQKKKNLSLWDKITLLYNNIKLKQIKSQLKIQENKIIKKHFGSDAPSVQELAKNVHMMFLNVHHIWDNNRPVPPSILYMGAVHLKKPKPIPKDLQEYFDASKNGVVYMSLGSKILFSDLPSHRIKVFLEVFASLPYDVLIKWNGGELSNKPTNVRLQKWLPQNDMLHHPKLKAYMMQGGLQSTDEAIAAQVPLIALPVMGDQWYNAEKFVEHGIGKHLDINNLNTNDLREAILDIAENKSYRENLARLSRIMEEQRAGGLQKAVYWTEYVAKHGALHLRSPLADATITEYFMLDVLGAILLVIILVLVLLIILIKFINSSFKKLTKLKSN